MKTFTHIYRSDIEKKFGRSDIDTLAAAIYSTYHNECNCTAHPFDEGLPWCKRASESGDVVVEAFRVAAIMASQIIKDYGIGGSVR
jgi:hypothetical protein